jgi:outer membrane receptor protein involved in Fe transport
VKNAIERGDLKVNSDVITFFNDDATLYGVEFEARKSLDFLGPLFSPFSVGGNLSLVKSEVELRPEDLQAKQGFFPDVSETRPLYDQSPYILNLDFNYSNPRWGTSATLVFNVAGPRIAITKLNTEDVYEQPTPTLDLVLSQKIGRQMTLKFAAKNLLDPEIERTYGEDGELLYSSYKRGLTFGLSLSYDF